MRQGGEDKAANGTAGSRRRAEYRRRRGNTRYHVLVDSQLVVESKQKVSGICEREIQRLDRRFQCPTASRVPQIARRVGLHGRIRNADITGR